MKRQKEIIISIKFIALFFCVMAAVFYGASCTRADDDEECFNDEGDTYLVMYCDATWHRTDNLTLHKNVVVLPGVTLTIEKGANIKFEKDSNGDDTYLSVNGRLVADGTRDQPIKITAGPEQKISIINFFRQDSDDTTELPPSFLRYVEIYGGGFLSDDGGGAKQSFWRNFVSPVYAETIGVPALWYGGGKVHFENCTFHDNRYADVEVQYNEFRSDTGTDNYLEIVNSNFEKSDDSAAVISEMKCKDVGWSCREKVLLKNDWYGDLNGPSEPDYDNIINGKIIKGSYYADGHRDNDLIVDPVIVVPGILCSATSTLLGGKLVLDPIMHIYDNLILSFEKNGYGKNKNLFDFPYEWRDSNVQTADLLKQKIAEVRNETKISKVDLVAHSMGGLAARYYIESPGYQNDVDQLITIGTPQHGSPKSYLTWEAGEIGNKFEDNIIEEIFKMEAWHATGSNNLKEYIQSRVLSVRDLLPDYNYLKESSGDMRTYFNNYPRNEFLEFINRTDKLENLKKVNFTNIVGNLIGKENTIKDFKVVGNAGWENGMPEDYGKSNRGIEYGKGDETVPLESSEGIAINEPVEIDAAHNDLPTQAQCEVIDRLTGKNNCSDNYVDTVKRITHILTFGVFSPIDIQIIAPDGIHWVGKNIKGLPESDKIDGAYYTGYDTDNEFATIPDPEDGEYQVVTEGTGNGEYTVKIAKISEDGNDSGQASESVADLKGTAVDGKIEEAAATVTGTQVTTEAVDTTPPTITTTVSPEPNENGWHSADVTVHFDATDESGIKPGSLTPDIILSDEGNDQAVTGEAEDNAGNIASKTISGINIDKTAPITTAEISGTQGNNGWYTSPVTINFSATDNLSGVDKTAYSLNDGSVQSGNSLTISDDGLHQIKYHSADLAGNEETEKTLSIKIDQTTPTVSITSPENKNYKNSGMLPIKFAVRDNLTAEESLKTEIHYDGNIMDNLSLDLSLEKLGEHGVSIVTTDEAGNESEAAQVSFNVDTDIDSISKNVKHYFSLGLIKKMSTEFFLEIKLRNIQEMMDLLDTFKSKWMPRWAKDRVIENLKRNINHQIDNLERQIQYNKNFGRTIDLKIQKILLEDLEAVKV